jgi:hypothetical protein
MRSPARAACEAGKVGNLLALVVPLVMALLKKLVGDNRLDANGLASVLGRQGPHLQAALDPRIAGALGFASPPPSSAAWERRPRARSAAPAPTVTSGVEAMARGATGGAAALTDRGSSKLLPGSWGHRLVILFLLVRTCAARSTGDDHAAHREDGERSRPLPRAPPASWSCRAASRSRSGKAASSTPWPCS